MNDIIAGLIAVAAVQREYKIRQEEDMKRRREEELERWKRQEAEEAEAQRFEELAKQVGQWQQANQIRAYVKSVKASVRASGHGVSKARMQEWVAWALGYADRVDPTIWIQDTDKHF